MPEPREVFGDIRDLLVALPHGDPYGGMAYVREDLFTVRHRLIAALDPAPVSVFEFGALVGYFLVTALDAAPSIRSVGWVDDESHTPESNRMCADNVVSVVPADFGLFDIRWMARREEFAAAYDDLGLTYDLVAVDSDHSYEGCLADLRAAHRLNPRWIFVDDWTSETHGHDIQAAVRTFIAETGPAKFLSRYDLTEHDTTNGLAVLTRKEHA